MKAIIMAGGKGKRLNIDIEKPLIQIGRRTILERVLGVLKDAGLNTIYVAVTHNTPKTRMKAQELNVEILQTPGKGYVKDIQFLMRNFNEFLAVSADLPFLNSTLIINILRKYDEIKQPISVVISKKNYENMGFTPSVIIDNFVPIGVNIVAKGEDFLYMAKGREAININTKNDLDMIIK